EIGVCAEHHVRGHSFLDPRLQIGEIVDLARTLPATTVAHAGYDEETEELLSFRFATNEFLDGFVVVDGLPRHLERVVPSLVQEQLASGSLKLAQIWVSGRLKRLEGAKSLVGFGKIH